MDHLAEAKEYAQCANRVNGEMFAQLNAQLAIAHAQIAQVETNRALVALAERLLERLPPSAETWSECTKRLRKEEKDGD